MEKACQYVWGVQDVESDMPSSLDVAILLSKLSADETTTIVCLLSDSRLRTDDFYKIIKDEFGEEILHMVRGIEKLHGFKATKMESHEQTERLRRMLLAMVDDVRVVLIKLAYRVLRLRELANTDEVTQKAQDTLTSFQIPKEHQDAILDKIKDFKLDGDMSDLQGKLDLLLTLSDKSKKINEGLTQQK